MSDTTFQNFTLLPVHPVLKILFWNADGLPNKLDELREFLEDSDIDIALIQETKFRVGPRYNICNYTLYRVDRTASNTTRPQGGTAIYVRKNLNHYEITDLNLSTLEASTVMVQLNSNFKILISSCYVRQNRNFPVDDFNKILNYHPHCIIAGDFNSKHRTWNCTSQNKFGLALYNFLNSNVNTELVFPPAPTHFCTYGSPSTIDLALLQNLRFNYKINTLDLFTSDHKPILLELDHTVKCNSPRPTIYTDWRKFQNILAKTNLFYPNIRNKEDIETAVQKVTDAINTARIESRTILDKPKVHTLPAYLRKLIRERNAARRIFQANKNNQTKIEFYRLKKIVRDKIYEHKQNMWENHISHLNDDHKSLWNFQRLLRKQSTQNFPPIHGKNGVAYDSAGKAEAFAVCYEDQFSPNYDIKDEQHDEMIDNTLDEFFSTPPETEIAKTNITEVTHIIKNLKSKRSSGTDKINNIHIKNLPPNIIMYLTVIINAIFKFAYFPTLWKDSTIVPIAKSGANHSFPDGYRPISLLSCLSKVAERVILTRILTHLHSNDLMLPEQFGFRQHHSTEHQLLRVTEFAIEGLQAKNPTGAVFLDVCKSFDKVWHKGLLFKLINLKFPDKLIHLIKSYLQGRRLCVRISDKLSSFKPITSGIMQGSVLGPTFHNIYFGDFPRFDGTSIALYADDAVVMAQSFHPNTLAGTLQCHLDILDDWLTKFKIKINTNKCQAIYFSHKKGDPPRLYLQEGVIEWVKNGKYLGVWLDQRLTWQKHIAETVKQMKAKIGSLRMLFYSNYLNLKNKILLYKTVVLPTALYGAPIYTCAAKTNIEKVEIAHNRLLRTVRHAHRYMRNTTVRRDLNIGSFKQIARERSIKFYNNIGNIPNEIIAEIPDYDYLEPSNAKRPRASLVIR